MSCALLLMKHALRSTASCNSCLQHSSLQQKISACGVQDLSWRLCAQGTVCVQAALAMGPLTLIHAAKKDKQWVQWGEDIFVTVRTAAGCLALCLTLRVACSSKLDDGLGCFWWVAGLMQGWCCAGSVRHHCLRLAGRDRSQLPVQPVPHQGMPHRLRPTFAGTLSGACGHPMCCLLPALLLAHSGCLQWLQMHCDVLRCLYKCWL